MRVVVGHTFLDFMGFIDVSCNNVTCNVIRRNGTLQFLVAATFAPIIQKPNGLEIPNDIENLDLSIKPVSNIAPKEIVQKSLNTN